MNTKRRLHDGIAGAVLTAGVVLEYWVDSAWLLVPGILGVTLVCKAHSPGLVPCTLYQTKPARQNEAGLSLLDFFNRESEQPQIFPVPIYCEISYPGLIVHAEVSDTLHDDRNEGSNVAQRAYRFQPTPIFRNRTLFVSVVLFLPYIF